MKFVKITPDDNVGVALTELKCGEEALGVTLTEDIPAGHKFALRPIAEGENIIKYSAPIGRATADVATGAWVHTHNVKTNLDGILEYSYNPVEIPEKAGKTVNFKGFKRKSGKVGIRNEIWVIPTVGCVNSPAEVMVKEVRSDFWCGQQDLNDGLALAKKYKNEPFAFGIQSPPVPENATMEEIQKIADDFVAEYGDCKIIICDLTPIRPELIEALYRAYRTRFSDYAY
jgi:altronate dehydratase